VEHGTPSGEHIKDRQQTRLEKAIDEAAHPYLAGRRLRLTVTALCASAGK
jgi:hypothetical protein